MPTTEQLFAGLLQIKFWGVMKLLVLIGLGLYLVFALMVVRQVQLMGRVLNGTLDMPIKLMAVAHLVLTVGVIMFALTML